jgi:prenylcysteine alpha-carboxyl methylesterase
MQKVGYHISVVVDNATKLFSLLVRGTKTWIVMAARLLLFTILLMPGWFQLLKYWFLDSRILRNVEFGKGAKLRNVMDIYLPHSPSSPSQELAPVVIFVSGGAWIIGYKLWSALVARGLATLGMLVVVPDYRNFPQGDIEDMMEDIHAATEWTYEHAHEYYGDKNKLVLAGQSAGAHICLTLLVSRYLKRKNISHATLSTFLETQAVGAEQDLSYPSQAPPPESDSEPSDSSDFAETLHADSESTDNPSPTELYIPKSKDGYTMSDSVDDKLQSRTVSTEEDSTESTRRSESEEGFFYERASKVGMGEEEEVEVEGLEEEEEEEEEFSSFNVMPMGQILEAYKASGSFTLLPASSEIPKATHAMCDTQHIGTLALDAKEDNEEQREVWFSPMAESHSLLFDESDTGVAGNLLDDCDLESDAFAAPVKASADAQSSGDKQVDACQSNDHPPSEEKAARATQSQQKMHQDMNESVLDKVRLYIGISGPLDLVALSAHLHSRGLDASILHWICRGSLNRYSPSLILAQFADYFYSNQQVENDDNKKKSDGNDTEQDLKKPNGDDTEQDLLPLSDFVPVALFHGSRDKSIPCTLSRRLAQLLQNHAGVQRVLYREYEGWTHTDAIVEAPLAGSQDFFCDVAAAVHYFTSTSLVPSTSTGHLLEGDEALPPQKRVATDDFAHTHHHHQRFHRVSALYRSKRTGLNSQQPQADNANHSHTNQKTPKAELEPLAPVWLVQCARFVNPF